MSKINRTDSLEQSLANLRQLDKSRLSARDQQIVNNYPLVLSVASHYQGMGLEMEDLVSEGLVGLIAAVDGYKPGSSICFAVYAKPIIRQRICHALSRYGSIIGLYDKAYRKLKEEGFSTPKVVSLDAPLSTDEDATLASIIAADEDYIPFDSIDIKRRIARLSKREREILHACIHEETSSRGLAAMFNLTQQRISQILDNIKRKLQGN